MATKPAGQSPQQTGPLADPPQTEPATHTVLTHLREMIVTGHIPPDTRLRAEALAAELAVSRTPIRSALAVLSAEGLVDYGVNRGYTVRAVTIGDVFDSIEVRAGLEGQAARMSVDLGWEAPALERLADIAAQGRAILDRGEWSEAAEVEWYRLNHAFHRTIHHAAQNTVLRNAIRMTLIYPLFGDPARLCPSVAAAVPLRLRQVATTTPEHLLASQDHHERLLDAIRSQDSAEAGRILTDHVLSTKRRLHAIATRR